LAEGKVIRHFEWSVAKPRNPPEERAHPLRGFFGYGLRPSLRMTENGEGKRGRERACGKGGGNNRRLLYATEKIFVLIYFCGEYIKLDLNFRRKI